MKYEIKQGEYLEFLNKNLVSVKNGYFYYPGLQGTPSVANDAPGRHRIFLRANTGPGQPQPAEYFLDRPAAAYLPMNYLNTRDIMGFLIWAGLRPMTELEFEKICRGMAGIPGLHAERPQFAWGSIEINNATGFANQNGANEAPANLEGNVAVATAGANTLGIGLGTNSALTRPMRSGGFATPVSSRTKAGATFWGVMEMSGNVWERVISLGNGTGADATATGTNGGRNFRGMLLTSHGNGETGTGANPNLPINGNWPHPTGVGLGFKGGSYLDHSDRARISDRMFINHNPGTTRHASFGGRGVRTDIP
jgi:formylglycine-generating enzyme required for sulfatase activity